FIHLYNFPLILKSINPAKYTNKYRILHSVTRLTLALKFAIARLKTAVRYLFLILPPPLEEGFLTTHSSATPAVLLVPFSIIRGQLPGVINNVGFHHV
ncbi:hypothetical protein P5X57_13070, partial [Enterobacter hormaechei]|uniref:hypothetical protein n=6 Tax=Enterobacter hormaechei TaxID=158836 RepID=UPI001E4A55FB